MLNRSHEVTVKDLILQGANIGGAIHAGRPEDEKQEALLELERQLGIDGYPAGVRTLRAIARVVLHGLDPLRRAVAS